MRLAPPRFAALALGLLGGACGVTAEGGEGRAEAILALEGDAVAGADVYDAECSLCHGLNGEGASGPTMAAAVEPHDRASLVDVLLQGAGDMPSFEELPDQDVADVVTYLEDTW
jgi:mono/diheme cytochrome c family protein